MATQKKKTPKRKTRKITPSVSDVAARLGTLYDLYVQQMLAWGALRQLLIEHDILSDHELNQRIEQLHAQGALILRADPGTGKETEEMKSLAKLLRAYKGPVQ